MSRITSLRKVRHPSDRHGRRPNVEPLEDRLLLYAFNGGEWVHGQRITYSFIPDGTLVGGISSNLSAAMADRGHSTAQWQNQFRRAAALWQASTNINLIEVPDDGSDLSVSGYQQNDSRFGDIRIAGIIQEEGTLGVSFLPPVLNGGTLAGDIVLNADQLWNVNTDYDLLTVGLHEFGHSLGLDHSTAFNAGSQQLAQSSVMYAAYNGVKQSLSTDDVAGIQGVYGPRLHDAFDLARSNGTFTQASQISSFTVNNQIRLGDLDITGSDVDIYYVVAPANTSGTVTFTMQSSELSGLSPRLQVLKPNLQTWGIASSTGYGATVTVSVGNVVPGQGFYIRASTAGGGSSTGAYGLLVNFSTARIDPIPPFAEVVESTADAGSGSTLSLRHGLRWPKQHTVQLGGLVGIGDPFTHGAHEHEPGPGRQAPFVLAPPLPDGTFAFIATERELGAKSRGRARHARAVDLAIDVAGRV